MDGTETSQDVALGETKSVIEIYNYHPSIKYPKSGKSSQLCAREVLPDNGVV